VAHTRLWTTYESKPAGTDNVNQGDDEIRATKVDIRERMAIDHEWNVSTAADGRHLKTTYKEVSAPTEIANYIITYGKLADGKCELHAIDEDGDEIQLTKGGDLNGEALGSGVSAAATATVAAATLLLVYPVGSIYTNASVATNPGTLLGFGTWVAFGEGRVLVGIDAGGDADFDTVEEEGGAKTVDAEHTHDLSVPHRGWQRVTYSGSDGLGASGGSSDADDAQAAARTLTSENGGNDAQSVVQPYIVVYMWKRTA